MAQHQEEARETQQVNGYSPNVDERYYPIVGQRLTDVTLWKLMNLIVLRVPHIPNIASIG